MSIDTLYNCIVTVNSHYNNSLTAFNNFGLDYYS